MLDSTAFEPARKAGFIAAQNWMRQHTRSLGAHSDLWPAKTVAEHAVEAQHLPELIDGFLASYSAGIVDLISKEAAMTDTNIKTAMVDAFIDPMRSAVETFAQFRELFNCIADLSDPEGNEPTDVAMARIATLAEIGMDLAASAASTMDTSRDIAENDKIREFLGVMGTRHV